MAFSVNEFASAGLPLGGSRASLFSVIVDTPNGVPNIGARISFTCSAASLPPSVQGVIEVPYFGRKVKIKGNRTFENWTVTILNDEDFQIRHALEVWSNLLNSHEANLQDVGFATTAAYRTTAQVTQYAKTGAQVRTYEFVNIWPVNISAIELNWETTNAVETFTCEFAYDYWKPIAPGTTGTFDV